MVRDPQNPLLTLRVGQDLSVRISDLEQPDLPLGEQHVHHARPRPQDHLPPGLLYEIAPEVLIRPEDDRLVPRDARDYLLCVGGGADYIRERLDLRRRVDVRDDRMPRTLLYKPPKGSRRAAIRERTP